MFGFGRKKDDDENDGDEPSQVDLFSQALEQLAAFSTPEPQKEEKPKPAVINEMKPVVVSSVAKPSVTPSVTNMVTSAVKTEAAEGYKVLGGGTVIKQETTGTRQMIDSVTKPHVKQITMIPGMKNSAPLFRTITKPETVGSDGGIKINQVRLVRDPVTGQMKKVITVNRDQLNLQRTGGASSPILMTQKSLISNNGVPKIASVPAPKPPIVQPLTNKDVSRLWLNDDIKLSVGRGMTPPRGVMKEQVSIEEEVEAEEDELGVSETYSDYMPSKLKIGFKHPDPVVETSSLSSVEPQDIHYRLSIPESVIDNHQLSALQLESITYACQQHESFLPNKNRAGYLIGDGAGVGKGRTVAGIIYENYLLGRKRAIWLSVSNDLKMDAERDLNDIGAGRISVVALNKLKYAKISSKINNSIKKGVIFSTYSSLIGESQSGGKYRTRLKQLLHWCGEDFDGVIIFDECHRAKNLCPVGSSKPTKTGLKVLELQNQLPRARIVYASATGASEPKNMAYMVRLGLWGEGTPFREFNDFIQAVERRGVGAMELVAMDMKLRGMYIARQLSFHGVTFRIEEVPIPREFHQVYNESVALWVEARQSFQTAANLIGADSSMRKNMWGQFWSAHQRFFKYLCISAKVPHLVKVAREAVKNGKCVVIGLQSTGEARTLEQLEEMGGELNDFVSTAKGVVQTLVDKHFPAPNRKKSLDLLGLGGGSLFDDIPIPSPGSGSLKRKAASDSKQKTSKRFKELNRVKDSMDNSSGDEYEPSLSDESEDDDESDEESSSDESEVDDNFNPFGGSDSDDSDPWLKKSEKKTKVKKVKPKKEKEKKKKKEKKVKDEDEEFDAQLKAAGLLKPFQDEDSRSSTSGLSGTVVNKLPSGLSEDQARQKAVDMKQDLLEKVDRLGDRLPPNALDEIIDLLGGPENVAEMTGRKGRVVSTDEGVQYESRREFDVPLEVLNLTEKRRFMDGEKDVAIISEAASSGISLQADRRVLNQKRRVHITLELPWSADRAIQQFGRTHRSNQVNAPEYVFLISELAGERRFAATVAKRLESLGALTHGDRRATETRDLSQFNIDNKFGRAALESVMKSVIEMESPLVPPPTNYKGNFFEDLRTGLIGVGMLAAEEHFPLPTLEKDYNNISKFLNRILGMKVDLQNKLFKYFTDVLSYIILQAKRDGKWDMGILDLGAGGENVKIIKTVNFVGNEMLGSAKTTLYTVGVERGLSWDQAMDIWREHTGREDGFYTSRQDRNEKLSIILAVAMSGSKGKKIYTIYRPNTGQQPKTETLESLKRKYKKVIPDIAQEYWDEQFTAAETQCSHVYWHGSCKRIVIGLACEVGLRSRTFYVLCGSVLSVWSKVESVLASMPTGAHSKMQIVRLRTDEGKRIVGSIIPANCVEPLTHVLSGKVKSEPKSLLQPFQQTSNFALGPGSRNSSTSSLVSAFGILDMPQF